MLFLEGRIESRDAERHANSVVRKFIDVGGAGPIAFGVAVGADIAERVVFAGAAENEASLVDRQRLDGLQIHRARQALADEPGVIGFVHGDRIDQLGGILIELDAATVAGAHLLATIQQGADELFRHAAHVDHLRAAVDALSGQAGQA